MASGGMDALIAALACMHYIHMRWTSCIGCHIMCEDCARSSRFFYWDVSALGSIP